MSTREKKMKISLSDLEIGDILEFKRKVGPLTYHHCGNYAGNNTLIHKGMAPGVGLFQALYDLSNNAIRCRMDSIQDVAAGSIVYRNNMFDDTIRPSRQILEFRVQANIGEADYNPFHRNCQHSCTKVRYDIAYSREADMMLTGRTSAFTKDMVQVSLDDYNSNLVKSSDINKCKHKDRFDFNDIKKLSENKNHLMICKPTNALSSIFESQPHKEVNSLVCLPDNLCMDLLNPFTCLKKYSVHTNYTLFCGRLEKYSVHTNYTLFCGDSFNKSLKTEMTPLSTRMLRHYQYDAFPSSKTRYSLDYVDELYMKKILGSYNQSCVELPNTVFTNHLNDACILKIESAMFTADLRPCLPSSTINGSLMNTADIRPSQTSSTSHGSLLKCLLLIVVCIVCVGLLILFFGIRFIFWQKIKRTRNDGNDNASTDVLVNIHNCDVRARNHSYMRQIGNETDVFDTQ